MRLLLLKTNINFLSRFPTAKDMENCTEKLPAILLFAINPFKIFCSHRCSVDAHEARLFRISTMHQCYYVSIHIVTFYGRVGFGCRLSLEITILANGDSNASLKNGRPRITEQAISRVACRH